MPPSATECGDRCFHRLLPWSWWMRRLPLWRAPPWWSLALGRSSKSVANCRHSSCKRTKIVNSRLDSRCCRSRYMEPGHCRRHSHCQRSHSSAPNRWPPPPGRHLGVPSVVLDHMDCRLHMLRRSCRLQRETDQGSVGVYIPWESKTTKRIRPVGLSDLKDMSFTSIGYMNLCIISFHVCFSFIHVHSPASGRFCRETSTAHELPESGQHISTSLNLRQLPC